jgi:hypothetical protein
VAIKISALTAGTSLSGSEQFEAVQSGTSVKVTATQVRAFANQESLTYRAVSTGFTETFAAAQDTMILFNAGTLATGTVTMPASPLNGQVVRVTAAMIVTALTVSPNAGQTMVGAPTAISTTTPFAFVYRAANTTWYRV